MIYLARSLRTLDYFTLAFGTMVGVGWLVVMDDWLRRGGPGGAMLAFAIGGVALFPIGYVYGQLTMAIPNAASEIAYTQKVFPPWVSFGTGWMMTLVYLIVCPWEAVAIGKIAAYLLPGMNSFALYHVAGQPVYLPRLLLGLALIGLVTWLNYQGIRVSADFQNWMTFILLGLFVLFGVLCVRRGSVHNFFPFFSHGSMVSTLLVLQVVPYFMTGFEAVPKCAEEARPEFPARGYFRAIILALATGALFYVTVIGLVALVQPWQSLTHESFATAVAFERAFHSQVLINMVFAAALASLLKACNGNFLAASRLLFGLGREGYIIPRLGQIHLVKHTPANAVFCVGALGVAGALLGEAILVPITEVGSLACAVGWLATCASYLRIEKRRGRQLMGRLGVIITFALILMKFLPSVPGHFTIFEYVALAAWIAIGLAARRCP
jgi:basic amino acid/polyamine antiporter, APA family